MSISSALSNALTGLTATARRAEVVSSNISNAMTEGYGRRTLDQSAALYGYSAGVKLEGTTRHVNPVTIAERRLADAGNALATGANAFHNRLESLVGTPEDPTSLSGVMATFESSLAMATGAPDSDVRLKNVSQDAERIALAFNEASDGIQKMRTEADSKIGSMIDSLNGLLKQTEEVNRKISLAINQGQETAALEDQRQVLIDQVGELVPVRMSPRDRGGVALYTTNGAVLLDGKAATIEFTEVGTVEPHMTEANGLLNGISINGYPMRIDSEKGALSGGAIGAQFAIRDEYGVQAQANLDATARNLVERYQDPTMDPTLAPGDAGLFTDAGLAFNAANEVGLAGRLELNNLVDIDGAGETWRLRDGLGAAAPGDAGDATHLNRMLDAMQEQVVPVSGGFGSKAVSMSEMGGKFLSEIAGARVQSDNDMAFASARLVSLEEMELIDGVDTDQELQMLMLVEQSYAANAKLIQAVDEMMQELLRIG